MFRHAITVLIAGTLALGACATTRNVGPPEPAPIVPALSFVNVREGQAVGGIMPRSPGAVVSGADAASVRLEVIRPDGSVWWERFENGTFACITGFQGGSCNSWTSTVAPDGTYRVRATASLRDGQTLKAEVSFRVGNTGPSAPTPTAPTPPSGRPAWKDVRAWMRWDVGCNLNDAVNSRFGMVTMSPRCTGRLLERADTDRVRNSGKWLLAYEDVAFAAPWDSRVWPSLVNERSGFIRGQNAWGSYEADLNADGWFRVLEAVIRDDLSRGYDGIWLDDCAGFWVTGGPSEANVLKYTNAVKRVRAIMDAIKPGAILVCNTDSQLVRLSVEQGSGFLGAVDGITIEGFTMHCFGPGDCRPNDPGRRAEEERWANEAQKRSEKVFTLDYAYDPGQQRYAWDEARKRGYTPAVNQGARVGAYLD